MTYLLDVNILLILHDPHHQHYKLVSRWFAQPSSRPFATCPITQSGMVRLMLQGVTGLDPFDLWEAREALLRFTQQPGHVYWPDDPSYLDATRTLFARMQGHRQITDAYLLGLAIHNEGKLATLDRGIGHLAGREFAASVEIVES
jgi:toxin-antitoxin system PIN domain toxin